MKRVYQILESLVKETEDDRKWFTDLRKELIKKFTGLHLYERF